MILRNKKLYLCGWIVFVAGFVFFAAAPSALAGNCGESSDKFSFGSFLKPFAALAEKVAKNFGYEVALAETPSSDPTTDPDTCGEETVVCSGGKISSVNFTWPDAPVNFIEYFDVSNPVAGHKEIESNDPNITLLNPFPHLVTASLTASAYYSATALNDVDFTVGVFGYGSGPITYELGCAGFGWDYSTTTAQNPYTFIDACDYTTSDIKEAKARVTRSGKTSKVEKVDINVNKPLSISVTASAYAGNAPINDVDFTVQAYGSGATGSIRYRLKCSSDGNWNSVDGDFTTTLKTYTFQDKCDYPAWGIRTAQVRVDVGSSNRVEDIYIYAFPYFLNATQYNWSVEGWYYDSFYSAWTSSTYDGYTDLPSGSFIKDCAAPDLMTVSLAASSSTPQSGTNVTFNGRVRNQGGSAAGATIARFCADNPNCTTPADGRIGSDRSVAGLAVNATSTNITGSAAWTATSAGPHTIYMCADAGKVITESDELNNCSSIIVNVISSLPNLVPSGTLPVNENLIVGQSHSYVMAVQNPGNAGAGASHARYCVDNPNCMLTSIAGRIGSSDPNVSAVGSKATTASVLSSAWTVPGPTGVSHTIRFCVDVLNEVKESNELDNCTQGSFIVVDNQPDMTARDLDSSPISWNNIVVGSPAIRFSAKASNEFGLVAITSTSNGRFCRNNSSCLSSATNSIGTDRVINSLGAGQIGPTINAGTTWTPTAGTHDITWCVDILDSFGNDVVDESNEGNNCITRQLIVKTTLTVSKIGSGTGTVISAPAGINCGGVCTANYESSALVTLTPTADASSDFAGWGTTCDSAGGSVVGNQCRNIPMTQSKSVTATFNKKRWDLNVIKSGPSGKVIDTLPLPNGKINCGDGGTGDCNETYDHGTNVTLSASASLCSNFNGWGSPNTCTGANGSVSVSGSQCQNIPMTQARNVTAYFGTGTNTLTIVKPVTNTGSGTATSSPAGINCGGDCGENYSCGTVVTLNAVADSGSVFVGWTGDSDCSDGEVTMDVSKTCMANFGPEAPPAPTRFRWREIFPW